MSEAVLTGVKTRGQKRGASVLGGALIVAGTSIGAGMFSLPVITSGAWFGWSLVLLLVGWYCMYSAGLYLLEANLRHREGASFDTMAQATLGNTGRLINGLAVGFVCYILTYAYISGGSSIIAHTLQSVAGIHVSSELAGTLFALVLGSIVVFGPMAVDKATTIMLGAMVIAFLGFSGGLMGSVSTDNLFNGLPLSETSPFALSMISFIAVSFGFQTCVPSLTGYMKRDSASLKSAILIGSVLTLAFYLVWQLVILGNLSRDQFPAIIAAGGNIGDLVLALEQTGLNMSTSKMLQLFSHLAVATSFMGVSMGLFDYIADFFGFSNDLQGRLKTAAITFVPPTVLGVMLPNGFIAAIGFAGIGAVTFSVLSPVLMAVKGRSAKDEFQVSGGKPRIALVFGFGLTVLVLEVINLMGMLPIFG